MFLLLEGNNMTRKKPKTASKDRDKEIVGQLTGGVLHEFNNVLQSIIGLAEMLDADPSLPEQAKASMKAIQKLGKNATKIVQSIGERDSDSAATDSAPRETIGALPHIEHEPAAVDRNTILLAEDDPMVLKVISSLLRHLGYPTLSAKNGVEALELFKQHSKSIALVITDLAMPKMDGNELAQKILALDSDAKIVIMTGYLQEDIQVDVEALGLVGWLEKPVSIHQLNDIIRSVVSEM